MAIDPSTVIYVSNFKSSNVQKFSSTGASLGVFCNVINATGVAFDQAGNLFVANTKSGNAIQKFAPDGSSSYFATSDLSAPHGLAFDRDGNLFVANTFNATIRKFTPNGVGTVFADGADGIQHPTDLKFDDAGNLWVTNAYGGPTGTGSVQKFTPDGIGTVFADSVFSTAYGIAFDSAGNVYVSNLIGDNVLKFAPDGTNLGVFCSTPLNAPHGMFFDNDGILYVANNAAATIEKFSPTGAYLGVFAYTGSGPHFFALSIPTPTPSPTPTPTRHSHPPPKRPRQQRHPPRLRPRLLPRPPRQSRRLLSLSRPTRPPPSVKPSPSASRRLAARPCFTSGKRMASTSRARVNRPTRYRPPPSRITAASFGSP